MKPNSLNSLLVFRCSFIAALVTITTLSLIDLRELPPINVWDKLEHASAFLLLSFLLEQSFPRYQKYLALYSGQIIFLLSYGVLIEVLQSYTPYREASALDVVADAVGIAAYWIAYVVRHAGNTAS